MGKIKQGILGGFTGKVGGVVGSSWKGIATIKARPISVANPKTAAQVGQRSKMSNTVAFAKVILADIIKPLWDRFSGQKSGYNAFVQRNISLFENAMPSPAADLVISEGKMAATSLTTCALNGSMDALRLAWTDDSGEGFKLATDMLYVVFVNKTKGYVVPLASGAIRSDALVDIPLDLEINAPDTMYVYTAFRRADGTVVSQSNYSVCAVGY